MTVRGHLSKVVRSRKIGRARSVRDSQLTNSPHASRTTPSASICVDLWIDAPLNPAADGSGHRRTLTHHLVDESIDAQSLPIRSIRSRDFTDSHRELQPGSATLRVCFLSTLNPAVRQPPEIRLSPAPQLADGFDPLQWPSGRRADSLRNMKKFYDYKIVCAAHVDEVERIVKASIAEGWELVGPACCCQDRYCQTLVKYEFSEPGTAEAIQAREVRRGF